MPRTRSSVPVSDKKRNRAPNYTQSEKDIFTELIPKYKDLIENKKTDAVTRSQKAEGWREICEEFNSLSTVHFRSEDNLKSLWDNLKKAARKSHSHERIETFKTGGGTRDTAGDPTNTDRKVLDIIGPSGIGFVNEFDGDSTLLVEDPIALETVSVELELDEAENGVNSNSGTIFITSEAVSSACANAMATVAQPTTADSKITGIPSNQLWGEYTPKMLNQKKPPQLKVYHAGSLPSISPPGNNINQKKTESVEGDWVQACKRRRPSLPDDPAAGQLISAKIELARVSKQQIEEENKRRQDLFEMEKEKKLLEKEMMELQVLKMKRDLGLEP